MKSTLLLALVACGAAAFAPAPRARPAAAARRAQPDDEGAVGRGAIGGAVLGGLLGGPFGALFGAQLGASSASARAARYQRSPQAAVDRLAKKLGLDKELIELAQARRGGERARARLSLIHI